VGQLIKDRRSDPRYDWSSDDILHATLRPGCVVHIVDLSAGGALVQATRPLRPGARLHFHLVLRHRSFGLVAHVLRCGVWRLDSPEGVTYRGALQFEERCDLFWETESPNRPGAIDGLREMCIGSRSAESGAAGTASD
jgi:PilZ domain-containing protein